MIDVQRAALWSDHANCLGMDPDLFFPTRGEALIPEVKRACRECTVRFECLQDALADEAHGGDPYGYRGGLTPKERARIRRSRRAAV